MTIERELQNLIGKGDYEETIDRMFQLVENNLELREMVTRVSARWSLINDQKIEGVIDAEYFSLEYNKLSESLLSVAGDISEKIKANNSTPQNSYNVSEDDIFQVYSNVKTPKEIWSGFVGEFKSYNDPWKMEYNSPEDYVQTHRNRYNDPNCGNYYFLFFPKRKPQGSYWQPFIRFGKFQAWVHFGLQDFRMTGPAFKEYIRQKLEGPIPQSLNHITAFLNFQEAPEQTFFRGFKEANTITSNNGQQPMQERVSIWYLMLENNDNSPTFILKSFNKGFWNALNKKWNKSRSNSEKYPSIKLFEKLLTLPDELFEHEVLVE